MENENIEQELDLNELMKVRIEKLEELKKQGKNPFHITKYNSADNTEDIKDNFKEEEERNVSTFLKANFKLTPQKKQLTVKISFQRSWYLQKLKERNVSTFLK